MFKLLKFLKFLVTNHTVVRIGVHGQVDGQKPSIHIHGDMDVDLIADIVNYLIETLGGPKCGETLCVILVDNLPMVYYRCQALPETKTLLLADIWMLGGLYKGITKRLFITNGWAHSLSQPFCNRIVLQKMYGKISSTRFPQFITNRDGDNLVLTPPLSKRV